MRIQRTISLPIVGARQTPTYKKGRMEDPGNYRPVSLTSVSGKVVEQITRSDITGRVRDNQGTGPSQRGSLKGRSCLTDPISFYDQVTRLVDEAKAVDVVHLDFSEAFDSVSHGILPEKMAAHGLGRRTLLGKKLAGRPGPESGGECRSVQLALVASGVPQGVSIWAGPVQYLGW